MDTAYLLKQINSLPAELQKEVADFVAFLKGKIGQKNKFDPKSKKKERKFGFAKGKIKMAPNFDAPLDEFKEYM